MAKSRLLCTLATGGSPDGSRANPTSSEKPGGEAGLIASIILRFGNGGKLKRKLFPPSVHKGILELEPDGRRAAQRATAALRGHP